MFTVPFNLEAVVGEIISATFQKKVGNVFTNKQSRLVILICSYPNPHPGGCTTSNLLPVGLTWESLK